MNWQIAPGFLGSRPTWDLHLNGSVLPLFARSDEVDRAVENAECAILTLFGRCQSLSHECMGHRIIALVLEQLPTTCKLLEWNDETQNFYCR